VLILTLRIRYKIPVLMLTAVLLLSGCGKKTIKPISKTNFILGTTVEISMYDQKDKTIIDKAFDRVSEIERKMTINNAEISEIIALNNASGNSEVKLSPDTLFVLEKGMEYSKLSRGKFDITIGPVVKLWNIGTEYAAIPEKDKLMEAVKLVGYENLRLNRESQSARLEKAGMKVDLGAIAKGYAADEAARILKENGVEHASINLGGNVMTVGGNPDGNPWNIGVQDPFNPRGNYFGIVPAKDQTVVTSGIYEKYFEENGKRYHHILDPFTGYPVENNLCSVSIIADKSIDGDGLSTTALLFGLEDGMKLIEGLKNVEAVFVTSDKKVYVSSGLKDIFTITNPEFILQN